MYASSAFYAKGVHPTVEEQVQLAKRISSSLSDISNQSSKGQSMYVNRKKRSVKWVHEGDGNNPTHKLQFILIPCDLLTLATVSYKSLYKSHFKLAWNFAKYWSIFKVHSMDLM